MFAAEVQVVLDQARWESGRKNGPFSSPADWRDLPIYSLVVDRFNNPSRPPRHAPFDDPAYGDFQGGTFAGVQAQLPYIKDLGMGAIRLGPVLRDLRVEPTFHGYRVHDFMSAEPRYAHDPARADDELRALVDAAHKLDLYVIFDIALDQAGDVFAYHCAPAGSPCESRQADLSIGSRGAEVIRWPGYSERGRHDLPLAESMASYLRIREAFRWPNELDQNTSAGHAGSTRDELQVYDGGLNVQKQLVAAGRDAHQILIRAYQYVLARFDVDGFCIDTMRHLKGDLSRSFGNAIREFALSIGKKNFLTFGALPQANHSTQFARFTGRNTSDGAAPVGIDAALDEPLCTTLKLVLKGLAAPASLAAMYQRRKDAERPLLSSHADAASAFVTFLDDHDVNERIRYVDPAEPTRFDDQVTMGLACLYALPGIPCVYYGTEQHLHGRGTPDAVREALWGGPGFDDSSPVFQAIQAIARVRQAFPALRYGRFYFRPVSNSDKPDEFAVMSAPRGVLAFSRILSDEEVIVVANTHTEHVQSVDVIVDAELNSVAVANEVLYSNKPRRMRPGRVRKVRGATVHEPDGSIGHGPVHAIRITLQPMEVQILGK
jgi:glycosidase